MPELPDLTVVADALHAALAGRSVRSAEAPGPLAVRGTPAEIQALAGQRVDSIRRRGKFLLFALDRDAIACNPMLTGRFQLAAPGDRQPAKTAVVLGFGPRSGSPADAAPWTNGADWMPSDGQPSRSAIGTRRRWARSTCNRLASPDPCQGLASPTRGRTQTILP